MVCSPKARDDDSDRNSKKGAQWRSLEATGPHRDGDALVVLQCWATGPWMRLVMAKLLGFAASSIRAPSL
jgi:hypothetical protein